MADTININMGYFKVIPIFDIELFCWVKYAIIINLTFEGILITVIYYIIIMITLT